MQFITSKNPDAGMHAMAERISSALIEGKKVLWLICGGSNIPTAAEAMNEIRAKLAAASGSEEKSPKALKALKNLTVGQTDERYGPVGHPDSNWQQMKDNKFNFEGVRAISILHDNKSLDETITDYERTVMPVFEEIIAAKEKGLIVGQFGMGEDGHIAGMLPYTVAVNDPRFVSGYEGKPFTRVTLAPSALTKINVAYAFVFGASKGKAVRRLRDETLSLDEEPAQILKTFPEAHLYSDQV